MEAICASCADWRREREEEGEREREREGGREGEREGGMDGGRKGGIEGEREGGRRKIFRFANRRYTKGAPSLFNGPNFRYIIHSSLTSHPSPLTPHTSPPPHSSCVVCSCEHNSSLTPHTSPLTHHPSPFPLPHSPCAVCSCVHTCR